MMRNRSVPTDVVLPHIVYEDVAEALTWLADVFGFIEHYRYGEPDGPVQGTQMHLGDAWIMLESAREGRATPAKLGRSTQSLTVFVDDVDAHHARARSAGAMIVEDLNETAYGERQYGVEDLNGHRWLFSRHIREWIPASGGRR